MFGHDSEGARRNAGLTAAVPAMDPGFFSGRALAAACCAPTTKTSAVSRREMRTNGKVCYNRGEEFYS